MNSPLALVSLPYDCYKETEVRWDTLGIKSGFSDVIRVITVTDPHAVAYLAGRGWKVLGVSSFDPGRNPTVSFGFTGRSVPVAQADMEAARRLTTRAQKYGMRFRLRSILGRMVLKLSNRVLKTRWFAPRPPQRPA